MQQLLPARVPLNYASLFSGIGGFDIGFDRAGMRCVAQAEWDKDASAVLQHHWPNVTHLKDVRDVTRDSFRSIDVLCGGFPCQDVSVAGKRAGLDGERSGLWFEFHRIITEHTPRWVVIENVPGLLTSAKGRDFAIVLAGLTGIVPTIPVDGWKNSGFARGYKHLYNVAWRVLDAQYYGLAQRRKRVFIVASFGDGRCAEVLFEREGSTGDSQPRRAQGEGATTYAIKGAAIGRKPENGHQYGEISADGTSYTLNTSEVHAVAGTLPSYSTVEAIDTRNSRSNGSISGTLQAKKSGGYSLNYINPIAIQKRDRIREWKDEPDRIRAIQDDKKSSTAQEHVYHKTNAVTNSLEAGRPTKMIDEYGARRLTPTECERLQGFPDGWTAVNGQSDSDRYKQLGNAVAVPVTEWIARRIIAADLFAQPA